MAELLLKLTNRDITYIDNEWCTKYCRHRKIGSEKECTLGSCIDLDSNDFDAIKKWLLAGYKVPENKLGKHLKIYNFNIKNVGT